MKMFLLIEIALAILMIVSMWKVFEKAGKPGWAAIVPIYNTIVMLQIAGKPIWWIVLFLIPLVNFVVAIIALIAFAKTFEKGTGFALGCVFLPFIFLPMLAFGDAQYTAPAEAAN